MRFLTFISVFLALLASGSSVNAETIRIAIGTQDTTINCATGGLLIRELHLLEKYLPHDGKYKDAQYDIEWENFTSGAPLTNEMVAGKLDFGAMADFPGSFNGVAFQKAGRRSLFITVLSGSVDGSGNGIVVPRGSPVQSLAELKGKTISVPFASTAHGMLLRAIAAQGWDPQTDVNIITQAPELAGSALQSNKIDAHADFVPFAELFAWRGFARKIYDGAQAHAPTFHGALVDADYAERYPEIVVAYLRAAIEADRLIRAEPEKYSELIAKVTGVDAEVVYLYHGPLGLQTRDFTWKPEYRQAVATSLDTLKMLKKTDSDLDLSQFVTDRYIRLAYQQAGLDYDKSLANYAQSPLVSRDSSTGAPITDPKRVAELWLKGEPLVRHYASPEAALSALARFEASGQTARVFYAQDYLSGIKLLGSLAWFVRLPDGQLYAFLTKSAADTWSKEHGGTTLSYEAASKTAAASR